MITPLGEFDFATPLCSTRHNRFISARCGLMGLRVNMDLPVAIAILLAYGASCVATFKGIGEVYFESISMFTFFLLLGRFFEQRAAVRPAKTPATCINSFLPRRCCSMMAKSGKSPPKV